jgi:hypothetical protein
MGRPKDFPNIYDDLLTKYKAKGIADKEYKELLAMARVSWQDLRLLCLQLVVLT